MQILIKIHHPHYLKTYDFHQVDNDHLYFDEKQTAITINAFSDRCVLPVNVLLLKKLRTSHLQLILAVTGTAIELLKKYRPDALESLRMLVKQPKVSILVTSFYNSCSDQFSVCEHNDQKELQAQLVRQVFGKDPLSLYCKQSTCVFDYETFTRSSRIELLDQIVESKISHHSSKVYFHFQQPKVRFINNTLLLQKLFSLEKMVKASGNDKIMENWRRLQDISYYEADSFQESFHKSLKNILTDFEISLIRERLSKNKRVQNEFASFL